MLIWLFWIQYIFLNARETKNFLRPRYQYFSDGLPFGSLSEKYSEHKCSVIFSGIRGFHLQFVDSTCNLRSPLAICEFHLQFVGSAYNCGLRISSCNYLHVLLFVCGFYKLFRIPKMRLQVPQVRLFFCNFEPYSVLGICLRNPKHQIISKKNWDSATNMILSCCGIRLQCTKRTVWPRNVMSFEIKKIMWNARWKKFSSKRGSTSTGLSEHSSFPLILRRHCSYLDLEII